MKKTFRRLISIVLVVVMCMQALPVTVFAALIDNDPEYNEEILDALTDLVGSEDEAERYYALLDHYGLLSEDGNLSESWEIWMDGEQVTLDDIIAELESEDCDLDKYVLVDGTAITLGNIKTILEIEKHIAYLQSAYFDGYQWTDEQQANLASLKNQLESDGITLSNTGISEAVWPSGVSHNARVSAAVYPIITAYNDNTIVTLKKDQSPVRMFDLNEDTKWYSTAGSGNEMRQEFPLYVQIELADSITIGSYGIVTGDDRPERDPYTWILHGSNDGEEWTVLDEQTEYSMISARRTEEQFELEKTEEYRFFRFEILERRGGTAESSAGYGVQISEMYFYDPDGNRISPESDTFQVKLTDALPGQQVSFTWQAFSGTMSASGGSNNTRYTITADENGCATENLRVTLNGPVNNNGDKVVHSSARLTWFVKLSDMEGALFDNGYPNSFITGYSAPNVSVGLMDAVKRAAEGKTFTFGAEDAEMLDYHKYSHTYIITDEYDEETNPDGAAYLTAFKWGVLDELVLEHDFGWTKDPDNESAGEYFVRPFFGPAGYPLMGIFFPADKELFPFPITIDDNFVAFQHNYLVELNTVNNELRSVIDLSVRSFPYELEKLSSNSYKWSGDVEWPAYDSSEKNLNPNDYLDTNTDELQINVQAESGVWAEYTLTGGTSYGTKINDPLSLETTTSRYAPLYTLKFQQSNANRGRIADLTGPAWNTDHKPGHLIPIMFWFDQPVSTDLVVVLNGKEYTALERAEETRYTSALTYLYEVQAVDDPVVMGEIGTYTNMLGIEVEGYTREVADRLSTPYPSDAITDVTAHYSGEPAEASLDVSVGISDNVKLTEWIGTAQDDLGKLCAEDLTVSLDGGETMHNLYFSGDSFSDGLYASIPVEIASDGTANYTAELFLNGELLLGKYASCFNSWNIVHIPQEALSAEVTFGNYEFEDPDDPIIYVQSDAPNIKAEFALSGDGYTYADLSSVAVYGTPEADRADFVWKSSDPTVAVIDKYGNITPTGKTGSVTFSISARNGGGMEDSEVYADAVYYIGNKTYTELQFVTGLDPFLTIPQNSTYTVDGKSAAVYWASNLCNKSENTETAFTVSVEKNGTVVYTGTVTGTSDAPASFAVIPGEVLTFDYDATGNTAYTISVSSEYRGEVYSASATIYVEALPAGVSLGKLSSYYILDTVGNLPIEWTVEHLNRADNADLDSIFNFRIARNNLELDISVEPSLNNGAANGIFNLPIENITSVPSSPSSYRDVYTVTIQAKNGMDSTWSYDSFLLYVYDAEALKIMIDGDNAGDSYVMTNVPAVSQMNQEQILALKRDIYLKNIISVNYGEYAWTEVADQIMWASADSSTASLNYQQATLYSNIEDYTYTSYRPTTELGLAGNKDGETLISAIHKLTGMTDTLDLTVETLADKLYLFRCYPKTRTTLQYQDKNGAWKTVISNADGEAAIFEANGIHSNVYCTSEVDGITYIGTFYKNNLKTGEGDWTKLERYPLNNINLNRTGYAYLYLKDEFGEPYTGNIVFRGGVYINGQYLPDVKFGLNSTVTDKSGTQDQIVTPDSTGKLSVYMNMQEWNIELSAKDKIEYIFQIQPEYTGSEYPYYPLLCTVDATYGADIYAGGGSAVVAFRANSGGKMQQFVAAQAATYTGYGVYSDILDTTGRVGPNNNFKEAILSTSVMWWGTDITGGASPKLQLTTVDGQPISVGEGMYEFSYDDYPFASVPITKYTVKLNQQSMDAIGLKAGKSVGLCMDYYADGETLTRHEELPFKLINLIGVGNVEDAKSIPEMLETMGMATDTNNRNSMDFGDRFVNVAMSFVADDEYNTGEKKLFTIQLAPTSDPTKFLGFIKVNVGNIHDNEQVTGIYAPSSESGASDLDKSPGLSELMLISGKRSIYSYLGDDFNRVLKREGVRNLKGQLNGYAESLIFFNENTGDWEIQILNGGFDFGVGATYAWSWNTQVGPVPFTATLTIGGTVEVSLDALGVSYFNVQEDATKLGTDFLTELRIYLYLHFFAGVGFDYAVVAFKLGIYGQISLDMRFQWLNRPYMDVEDDIYNVADGTWNDSKKYTYGSFIPELDENGNPMYDENGRPIYETVTEWESPYSKLDGQHFKADGQIGLQFVVRFLFISFEHILFSFNFNLFDETTGDWETIQTNWEKNKASQLAAISGLLGRGALSVANVNGQQVMSLNLAPSLESRAYLADGSYWNDGSVSLFALDTENALSQLQYNSYPYANPVVSEDGAVVAFLSDMGSENVEDTRASFALRNEFGMYDEARPIGDASGLGDAQISLAGTGNFAVAAWTRQTKGIEKDAGSPITDAEQMIILNSSEIYAGVYNGTDWTVVPLTANDSADVAPVVAANGNRAVVAWRAVTSSYEKTGQGYTDITNFSERDTILYRIFDGSEWSDTYTLYNGTSGAVKGISAEMLNDGTAAVAYTLDTDSNDNSITDRDIYYAVIDTIRGDVGRNVRATYDSYMDENPQLTSVTFPSADGENKERFVLGWYTEQSVASDSAEVMSAGEESGMNSKVSDIRLMAFDADGIYAQLLPDSISQAADADSVSITPSFRFSKNADTINELSIVWVQRAGEITESNDDYSEKDEMKGIKFYTYGQNDELIGFTGAIDIAQMEDATLIDHFDAYVSDSETNEIKAVILGTTYGANGVVTKTGTTVSGDLVQYSVPSATTSLYTATEVYTDRITVPAVLADYDTIRKGYDTEIMFTVENKGIHAVNKIEISIGDGVSEPYVTTYSDINLLPGSSINLYADYTVPVNEVRDVEYTVHAEFDESLGAKGSAETTQSTIYRMRMITEDLTSVKGSVYLDLPELEITGAEMIMEKSGVRGFIVKLNNSSDASLAKSNRAVRISFYSDSSCTLPIDSRFLPAVIIDNPTQLAMIDEGGFSRYFTLNVKEYLRSLSNGKHTEIPAGGIPVYIKAETIEYEDGETVVLPDIYDNNFERIMCESLYERTGKDVMISYELMRYDESTIVSVKLQNTRLGENVENGNVLVYLYDASGNELCAKQYYTAESTEDWWLNFEEEKQVSLVFTEEEAKNAVKAEILFLEFESDEDSSELAVFPCNMLTHSSLTAFKRQQDGSYLLDTFVNNSDITEVTIDAVAKSRSAKITINGEPTGLAAAKRTIPITENGITIIEITVESASGKTTVYRMNVSKNEGMFLLNYQTTRGKTGSVSVTKNDSVAWVYSQIASKLATTTDKIELIYGETVLESTAGKTLADYDITNTGELTVKIKHKVSVEPGYNGTGTPYTVTVYDGESYTLPVHSETGFAPQEEEASFIDWYVFGSGYIERFKEGYTITITTDTAVTATYTMQETIYFYKGAADGDSDLVIKLPWDGSGMKIEAPDMPSKVGYSAVGWYVYDMDNDTLTDIPFDPDKFYTETVDFAVKYVPYALSVEKTGAEGYTAVADVGTVKDETSYSWHPYSVEETVLTEDTDGVKPHYWTDGNIVLESKYQNGLWIPDADGNYLILSAKAGDVLVITPANPSFFHLAAWLYDAHIDADTGIVYITINEDNNEFYLVCYDEDEDYNRLCSSSPISVKRIRPIIGEAVAGENDALFSSGEYGNRYIARAEFSDGTFADSAPFTYELGKTSYTVSGINSSYFYTGEAIKPTVLIKDGAYTLINGVDYDVTYGNNTTVEEGGFVNIRFKGNYGGEQNFTFAILARNQSAFSILGTTSATYGDAPITLMADGGSGNGTITWKITSGSEFAEISGNGTIAALTIKGAGTVVVEAAKASDGNYNAKVDTHSIVISKADASANNFTYIAPTDLVYNKTAKAANVTGNSDYGEIAVHYYSDSEMTNVVTAPVNVGTYCVGITTAGGANYNAVTAPVYVGEFTISPRPVAVTAEVKSMKYGDDVPELTYTHNLIDGDLFTGALATTAVKTSDVGEYDITIGSLENSNYEITFTGAKLTVTKADGPATPAVTGSYTNDGITYTYTVDAIEGAEYSMNGSTWQDSNIFSGLSAGQKYTFYARIKETKNVNAGEVGTSAEIDLSKLPGNGTVTIADWTYGTYDETASTPAIESTTNGIDNVTYLYESTDGKGYIGQAQPINAGTYRLTVTFAATDTHNEAKASADFTIFKATPDVTAPTNLTATYKDMISSVQLPEGWAWNGIDSSDLVGDAGENSFSVIYTHPEEPDNYEKVTDEVTIAVSPKEVTATVVLDAYSFVYSGSEHRPGITVKDGEAVIPSGEYTASCTNNVNAGTATVSIADVDGGNYTVSGSTSFEITKKASVAIPAIEREFVRTVASVGNEIDIEEMLPDDHGNVSYRLSDDSYTVLENVSVSTDGKLVFDTKTADASASNTITVEVEMQNYTDVTVTVSVILNEKTTQSITGVSAAEGLVYNKKAQQGYTGTPASEKYTGAYEITYTGRNNSYNSTVAPTDAGDYTVTFKIPDSDLYYSGNVSVNFTIAIAKAEIVVDTTPIVRSYGEAWTLPEAETNFGTVIVDKNPADMVNVGEYTVTYTVADNENYNGDTKEVKVTIVPKKITRPTQASAVTYTGSAQTYAVTETADYTVSNGVQTEANEEGYNVIIALKDKDNTVWDDETVADLTHKFIINRKAIEAVAGVTAPAAAQTAQTTINGENYSGTAKWNPDTTTFGYYTAYDVTLTLTANANYKFADTITLEGYAVSSNNGTTLVLTKTFDKTAKAKITGVTAPTFDKLEVYGTLEDALSVMPNNIMVVTEAGSTTLPIAWAVVGEYDKTPGVSNTFKWTANVGDYDANGQTLTGNITVENADALGVVNTGTPAEITYDTNTFDVSTMFTKDTNAGDASYEIVVLGIDGEGAGTLGDDGKTLTITKSGIITVNMTTAAVGAYAQGSTQTTLTVNLGTGVADVAIEGWTYGEDANAPTVASETNGTDNVTYLYESTDDKGYNSNFAPTTAGAYKVTATFAATDLYAKTEDSAEFTIEKAQPTVKTPPVASRVKKGNLLSKSTLTGGEMTGVDGEALEGTFAWKTPETEMNTRGNIEVTAVFAPNDTVNYKTADVTLIVEVYTTSTGGSGISVTTYYDVKFNTNGGSNVPAQSIRRNSTANEPKAPTKDGYTFEGWYTDAQCTKAYDFDAKVTKDITLYAKWSENKPIVHDECDGTKDDNCPSVAYGDLDTKAWYHLDVDYALEKGLINGMGEGIFAPDGKLSRAMLVTVLWRMENEPVVNYLMPFEDVENETYYTEAVRWAASEKIVNGVSETEFAPNSNITREQIAAIMHRYAQYKGYDVTVGENTNILSYDDFDSISEYAISSMQYAVGSGLMKGKSESTLNPLDNATRAEIAAVLHRFIENHK